MPALTLHLIAFKDPSLDPTAFVDKLKATTPGVHVVVASRPRHIVVRPSALDANLLTTQRWDVMLLLQNTQSSSSLSSGSPIPAQLQSAISAEYRILAGIPSKLLTTYPERDARLKRQTQPPLTGSLDEIRRSSKETSQNLEVSPELLAFMDQLSADHDKPVTMLNLLHFHRPDGKKNYFDYGQAFIPVAGKRGGNAKLVGNVVQPPSAQQIDSRRQHDQAEHEWWNEISIVHYPSIRHFCDMLAGQDYQKINEKHRLKASNRSLALPELIHAEMYLPRSLISHLYLQLLRSHHPLSPPVLILVALEPDALCACRILTTLLKRDYIAHKIQPIAGYGDLARAGEELVRPLRTTEGGSGGVVVCLGVGGLVDLSEILCLTNAEDEAADDTGGVEAWVIDARRPWNLVNVFGGQWQQQARENLDEFDSNSRRKTRGVDKGGLTRQYTAGQGGVIVFDDGDIEEELSKERDAYYALEEMPEVDDDGDDLSDSESEDDGDDFGMGSKKRKSWSGREEEDSEDEEDERPRQRRRSNSSSPIPSSPSNRRRTIGHDSSNSSRTPSPEPNVVSPLVSRQPSARTLRRRLLRLKRKHESVLQAYYNTGTAYSEPISSMMYSLASELGREDNDLLWLAIVGTSSMELSGRTMAGVGISSSSESGGSAGWGGSRGEHIRQILRDEVHRLNPPDGAESGRDVPGSSSDMIPTTARSPTDTSIRLSPEPRFLLVRHWSLYESMLHSPYLASRLHVWTENGRKRLHKLLAKMGISLTQCNQNYTHMDMELKRVLRSRLLKYAPMYGLEGLVPPPASGHSNNRQGWGFVRSWGWKACLSATDVAVILGSILEVGPGAWEAGSSFRPPIANGASQSELPSETDPANLHPRFWSAYDALSPTGSDSPTLLVESLPLAKHLHRAILRTGTSLLSKHQIRHLRAFRIAVVKEGPDVKLFTNPGALTKLALWVAEAIQVQERDRSETKMGKKKILGTPLVLAGLDEDRGVYVVVGTGGGGGVIDFAALAKKQEAQRTKKEAKDRKRKEREDRRRKRAAERARQNEDDEDEEEETEEDDSSSGSDSDDGPDDEKGLFGNKNLVRNRFGIAFQEVVQETSARVRIDSFENCVVEVQKEDLGGFLEALSFRSVVG
ncbi:Protein TSD2 [Talaromyces islandicus]|uniref:Protein TSD2 n=1 Tax=Talaromyces islandicus TaxID=28573 RepID=A0A0U1M164_TALIS|nr:Protein TSD2 [Talaromyces islandicus]